MAIKQLVTTRKTTKPAELRTAGTSDLSTSNTADRRAPLYMSNALPHRPRRHIPNTRDSASAYLSLSKVIDLGEAAEHATLIGCPLTVFVTIHFGAAQLRHDYRAQDAISRYLRLIGQWLRTHGIPNTFIWAIEHATGTGEHVHMLLHCPPWLSRRFKAKLEGVWMEKAGMLPRSKAKNGIVIKRVGPRSYHPTTHTGHATHERMLFNGALLYHLKAIDRDSLPVNDNGFIPVTLPSGRVLTIEPDHSNAIYGRRCSRSQNISANARAKYQAQLLPEPSKGLAAGAGGEAE